MPSSTKLKDRTQSIKMYEFTQWKAYASCMCTGYQLIDHSMHVRQQDAELTSTYTHHNAQNNQEKFPALRIACHHTTKTYKHKYKLVLCQHRAYATPTHFTRIDGKATPLFTHLTYSSPDTRASSSTFTQPPHKRSPYNSAVPTDVENAGMQMQMEGTQESKCFGKYASCNGMQRQEKMDLLTWGRSICEHS